MSPHDIDAAAQALTEAQQAARAAAHPVLETPIYDEVVALYPHIDLPEPIYGEDPHPATELLPIITVEVED